MNYKWTCENITSSGIVNKECLLLNGTSAISVSEVNKISFPAGVFWGGSQMKWTLTVSKSFGFHTTYVIIKIIPTTGVLVGIKTSSEGLKVNRNKLVILSAVAYSTTPYDLRYEWRSEPELPSDAYANGIHEKYLKILPYKLDEDTRYTFICAVTDIDGTTGDAIVRVTVNRAPRYGKFIVTPESGISAETQFELKASGWNDYDLPLTYVFSFFDKITNMFIPLGSKSETDTIFSTFVGEGNIELKLEIFDNLNASTTVYQTISLIQTTTPSESLLQKANDVTAPPYERLNALIQTTQIMGCAQNTSANCINMVDILDSIDRKITEYTLETDSIVVGILNSLNIQESEKLQKVMEILSRIGNRENSNIMKSLSIYDEQFADKRIQYGLTSQTVNLMSEVVGKTIKYMNDVQIFEQQTHIVNTVDVVARSLLKDGVPNEKPISLKTDGFSIIAQKISFCGNHTSNLSEGSVENVGYSIPICDILPLNQTKFNNKTMNKQKPYDVIIQVFDRNVVGDCSPLPTKLLRVVLYDDYQKVLYPVQNVLKGINFTFYLNETFPEDELGKVSCVYYEEYQEDFTPITLQTTLLSIENRQFLCTSSHLTEFTLMYLSQQQGKKFLSAEFWLLAAILFMSIIMHLWAVYSDRKDSVDIAQILNEKAFENKIKESNRVLPQNLKTITPPEINVSTYDIVNADPNASVNKNNTISKTVFEDNLNTEQQAEKIVKFSSSKIYNRVLTIGIIAKIILVFFTFVDF